MLWRRLVLSASTAGAVAVSVHDGYTAGDYEKFYAACQAPSADPLDGCPPGTLLVDGTGAASSVRSIQVALDSVPSASATAYTILVLPGIYTEQLNVTQNAQITLLGQTVNPSNASSNTVTVYGKKANAGTYPDNVYAANLIIAPNYNASATGYGPSGLPVDPSTPPASPDFRAYNIGFVNDFAPQSAGPSLTLSTAYSYTSFYRCGFYSYQDTIFIGKLSRAYMYQCVIGGQTDFLYGFGTLWIDDSDIKLRGCG
jgi:pectin methylesterase-like acyl-CoA thioesterase